MTANFSPDCTAVDPQGDTGKCLRDLILRRVLPLLVHAQIRQLFFICRDDAVSSMVNLSFSFFFLRTVHGSR